jgi:hypothetical protein
MSWGMGRYNTAGLPALVDFADAKKHYESVVPIRGRSQVVKPAGKNRRFSWYTIEKNMKSIEDGSPVGTWQESYGIRVYGSDLVEFLPNGNITLRTSKWASPTTMSVLYYSTASFGSVFSERGKWYFTNKAGKSYVFYGELPLHNKDGVYEPITITQEHKHRVDRKAMNARARKYKAFTDYATQMLLIEPNVTRLEMAEFVQGIDFKAPDIIPDSRWRGDKQSKENRAKLLGYIDKFTAKGDLGLAYELACYMAVCFGHWQYRANLTHCTPDKFKRGFKEMLKYSFRDEVFVKEVQEVGVPFHDVNKKYFYFN